MGCPTVTVWTLSACSTSDSVKLHPRAPPLAAVWVSMELDLATEANEAPALQLGHHRGWRRPRWSVTMRLTQVAVNSGLLAL